MAVGLNEDVGRAPETRKKGVKGQSLYRTTRREMDIGQGVGYRLSETISFILARPVSTLLGLDKQSAHQY